MVDFRESPFGRVTSVAWGRFGLVVRRQLRTDDVCALERGPYIIVLDIYLSGQVSAISSVTGSSSGVTVDLSTVPNDGLDVTFLPDGYPALWASPVSLTHEGQVYRTLVRLLGGSATTGDPPVCDFIFGPDPAWELGESVTAVVTTVG